MKRVQLSAPDYAPGPCKDCLSVALCAFSILSHLPICSHLLFANARSRFLESWNLTKHSPLDLPVFLSVKRFTVLTFEKVLKCCSTSSFVAS